MTEEDIRGEREDKGVLPSTRPHWEGGAFYTIHMEEPLSVLKGVTEKSGVHCKTKAAKVGRTTWEGENISEHPLLLSRESHRPNVLFCLLFQKDAPTITATRAMGCADHYWRLGWNGAPRQEKLKLSVDLGRVGS